MLVTAGYIPLQIQAIADGEVAAGMQGLNPTLSGQLTKSEIERCEADSSARLKTSKPKISLPKPKNKGARYTPISKRQDRPDAIAWLIKNYSELSDGQISRLIGTTKPTINSVREKTHQNSQNIAPAEPYLSRTFCSGEELEKAVIKARKKTDKTIINVEHDETKTTPIYLLCLLIVIIN